MFLRALEARTGYAGHNVLIVPEYDFTLAWCAKQEELVFLVEALL